MSIPYTQLILGVLPLLLIGLLLADIAYRRESIGRREGVALVLLYIIYLAALLSFT